MNPAPFPEPKDILCNPIDLNFAASELEVYKHERLAYTEIPAHQPESHPSASNCLERWLATIHYWVITHC